MLQGGASQARAREEREKERGGATAMDFRGWVGGEERCGGEALEMAKPV